MTELNIDEKLYTESEVLQVLKGLMNAYWSRPWYSRWLFKPWFDALATAALVFGGNKIVEEIKTDELFEDIDKHLR